MDRTIEQHVEAYETKKRELGFFDCNCWWDPTHFDTFRDFDDFEAFYASLGRHGIQKAVLTSAESRLYDAGSGNDTALMLAKSYDNLWAAYILTPDLTFTGGDMKRYIYDLDPKVAYLRAFPRTFKYSMNSQAMHDAYAAMEKRRLPLVVWHAETSWDTIGSICKMYPDLPVIVEGNDVKLLYHNRFYLPLYKEYKNLHLVTHNMIIFNEVDFFANDLDPARLLFGSYYLYNAPDAAMSSVILGDFKDDVKHMIAHGNLERLLKGIK